MKKIDYWLFIESLSIGGKITTDSVVHGYTENIDVHIFRSHPSYSNTGCWYDWTYFRWQGFEQIFFARIMMILDLSECDISYETDIDPDIILFHSNNTHEDT